MTVPFTFFANKGLLLMGNIAIESVCFSGYIGTGGYCYWECLLLWVCCYWELLLMRVFASEGFCYWGLLLLRAFASEGDCYCGFLHVGDFERCSVWDYHGIHGCFGGLRKARQIPRESWGWGGGRYKTSSWSADLTVVGGIKKTI